MDRRLVWPNVFFVGVPKAGTTYINEVLSGHPDIFCPSIKSPNFMNADLAMPDLPRGAEIDFRRHSHAAVIRDEEIYLQLYRDAGNCALRVDCSVDYLRSKVAAANIAARAPEAKIIAVLRNPIERCFSHYLMDKRIGRPVDSFEREIEKHLATLRKNDFWGGNYIEAGFYAEQLARYFDHFPRENIFIGVKDDLDLTPQQFIGQVCGFLDVAPIEFLTITDSNGAHLARMDHINRLMYASGLKRVISRRFPRALKKFGKAMFYTRNVRERLSPGMYLRVAEIFGGEIQALSSLLGRDFSPWLNGQRVDHDATVPSVAGDGVMFAQLQPNPT